MKTTHRRLIYAALGLVLVAFVPLSFRAESAGGVRRGVAAVGGAPSTSVEADAPVPAPPLPVWPPKASPSKPQRVLEAAKTLSALNRGISAAPGQPEGTFVQRDQNVSAFFNEKGVTLAMLGSTSPGAGPGDMRGAAVRWNAADA